MRQLFSWLVTIALIAPPLIADSAAQDYVETEHQEAGMRACPPGYAMGGIDVAANRLWCRAVGAKPAVSSVVGPADPQAPGRQSRDLILVCPAGAYARGYDRQRLQLLCSRSQAAPRDEVSLERDSAPGEMTRCPEEPTGSVRTAVVTGVRRKGDRLLCSFLPR